MHREFPGLYWDEERQRYFPLSSRPASQSAVSQSVASSSQIQTHMNETKQMQKGNSQGSPRPLKRHKVDSSRVFSLTYDNGLRFRDSYMHRERHAQQVFSFLLSMTLPDAVH